MSCSASVTKSEATSLAIPHSLWLLVVSGLLGRVVGTWWSQRVAENEDEHQARNLNPAIVFLFAALCLFTIANLVLSIVLDLNSADQLFGRTAFDRLIIIGWLAYLGCFIALPNLFIYQFEKAFAQSAYAVASKHIWWYRVVFNAGFTVIVASGFAYNSGLLMPKWLYLLLYAMCAIAISIAAICLFGQMISRLISVIVMSHRFNRVYQSSGASGAVSPPSSVSNHRADSSLSQQVYELGVGLEFTVCFLFSQK